MLLAVGCRDSTDAQPAPGHAEPGPGATRPSTAHLTPRTDAFRIVFLGDSLSAGLGLAADEAFPAIVEHTLRDEGYDVDVLNAGVSGDTSAGGLSRLDWTLRGQPDLVVIELGGNDALRGQPVANIEANLRAIVERVRKTGAEVLLLGMDIPTNYGRDYAGGFAALYPRIAEDLDVPLVPEFVREVGSHRGLMQLDGLHPSARGHRRLAESLVPYLKEIIIAAGHG